MKRIGTRLLPAGLPKIARLLLVLLLGAPTPASPTPAPTPPPVLYMVTTLAGGSSGSSGSADGVGGAARFNHPVGIAMDAASGVALVADRMKTHIKTVHEKSRDHGCRYCPGVAFGEKGNLMKHINLVHLKLREHACPYCPGVAYQTKSTLTRHIETVHEKRRDHACPTAPTSPSGTRAA